MRIEDGGNFTLSSYTLLDSNLHGPTTAYLESTTIKNWSNPEQD